MEKKTLTVTIGTETLPKYRDFSIVDVFHHFGRILFHDIFVFEGFTYSLYLTFENFNYCYVYYGGLRPG